MRIPSLADWIKTGLAALTFLIAFKFIAGKTGVPALQAAASYA